MLLQELLRLRIDRQAEQRRTAIARNWFAYRARALQWILVPDALLTQPIEVLRHVRVPNVPVRVADVIGMLPASD